MEPHALRGVPSEEYALACLSLTSFKLELWCAYNSLHCEAFLGSKAPDAPIVILKEQHPASGIYKQDEEVSLLSLQRMGRPLVLCFGSCTWPPFMLDLAEFSATVERFSHIADFAVVYVQEAHPEDGLNFKTNPYTVQNYPRRLAERLAAARLVQPHIPGQCWLAADTMTDQAAAKYYAFPERLYVIQDGVVAYAGKFGPFKFSPKQVAEFLENYEKSLKL